MKFASRGFRVAVFGASSLLGKELVGVLEDRKFSISRLVSFEDHEEEPDLPIVDLRESLQAAATDQDVREQDLDFAFLAAPVHSSSALPLFLRPATQAQERHSSPPPESRKPGPGATAHDGGHCSIIDLTETFAGQPTQILSIPFLEKDSRPGRASKPHGDSGLPAQAGTRFFASPLSSTILISTLLLRLAAHFRLERVVAQVYEPASQIGPRAVEELQKQTVNLLSFQKIPKSVFGAQLAFNLLPRLGGPAGGPLKVIEGALRRQLRSYLADRAPAPALHLFQVPVFYSLGVSLYVETSRGASREAIAQALRGEPVRIGDASQPAPSQVEAAGSSDILVDAACPDPERPSAFWLWAVADNLRLTAANAVDIAEKVAQKVHSRDG